MRRFKLINNIIGWMMFAVAAIVYLMTIEPTASFWDCPEFIVSAYKLEIGHPPGAPFFMLVGNLFTQLTSDPTQVAKMVNASSALLSAFTILFLFWSITHLTRKLVQTDDKKDLSIGQTIVIIGSGIVGALVYTFSDTFWFSAVEAEVYAFSSMLTALVFWLILKWEENAEHPHSDKWIILIAYVMGLSIGVHLLNLLCIPAIVLIYYYKKNEKATWKGGLVSLLISFGLILVLMYGIIPGFTKVGGWFELFFVNAVGLPYNSGLFIFVALLFGSILWSIFETLSSKPNEKRAKFAFLLSLAFSGILFMGNSVWLWVVLIGIALYFLFSSGHLNMKLVNLISSSLLVIWIGFSAYAVIPIRSSANPPMDENSPEDVFSLAGYLNREQYGETPLIYGHTYASEVLRDAEGNAVVSKRVKRYGRVIKNSPDEKDRYVVVGTSPSYKYTNEMLFPRMHSTPGGPNFQNHIVGYQQWGGVENQNIKPSVLQNIQFFFNYQLNYMYFRYFMWNFSGRQNDLQGDGGITKGNWISGIPFIDQHILGLGPQDNIAPDIADNKGRNVYFMLPFILGLIGIFYQLSLKKNGFKSFSIVFMLFFMTGIAIVLYLNQTPFEPRERDYAYAGSFYAFSIWVGMGVAGISLFLRKYLKNTVAAASIATLASIMVPLQMAAQNWDDHDRSGRYMARDAGMNYLNSVGPNGIIFCNGDNDTFPLWYLHEVEGFRTDTRACNMSYLQTEWYVDQMVRQAYESPPLPIRWPRARYASDKGSHAYVLTRKGIEQVLQQNNIPQPSYGMYYDQNAFRDTISLKQTMENLRTGNNATPKNPFPALDNEPIIPGNLLYLDVDTSKVDWKKLNSKPKSRMIVNLGNSSVVYRHQLMLLEMLTNINDDNWERPVYFAATVDRGLYAPVENNLIVEGITYRVTPGEPLSKGVNTEIAYDNMMNKFRWGGVDKDPNIYLDVTSRNMIYTFRMYFSQLIAALIEEGKNDMALAALDKCIAVMPDQAAPFRTEGLIFARNYLQLGEKEKGTDLIVSILDRINKNLSWYDRLSPVQIANSWIDISRNNLDPLLLIADIYQVFDHQKYITLVDDLLKRAQFYYGTGVYPLGDDILKELTNSSLRSYYGSSNDTVSRNVAEQTMQKTLKMMQQYNPKLFEQYGKLQ
ncbi:MAG: protein O-mannosyl-transferase family [Bacteroidota bacterium]